MSWCGVRFRGVQAVFWLVMIDVLPPETERLAFRRFDGADLEPMHSYQSREDYAQYAWRGPRTREECERTLAENSGLVGPLTGSGGEPSQFGSVSTFNITAMRHLNEVIASS